ncbi:hypothetical protein [Mesobacillus harenae]|uniref:hypothetical protein n=1 Tax=Mesobacillus harenae TaxID=2213203 RepID=UPI001580839B|nr:hypothetical protein [Mesobacillus harenae]
MIPIDYAVILEVRDDHKLHLLGYKSRGERFMPGARALQRNEGISWMVWHTMKPVIFHSRKQWGHITKGGYLPNCPKQRGGWCPYLGL